MGHWLPLQFWVLISQSPHLLLFVPWIMVSLSAPWTPCHWLPAPAMQPLQTHWVALRCLLRPLICLDLTLSLLSLWLLMVAQGILRHCPMPEIPQSSGPRLSTTQEVSFSSWGTPSSPRVTQNEFWVTYLWLANPSPALSWWLFFPVLDRNHFPLFRE